MVWVTIGSITFVSVYLTPNQNAAAERATVERLEDDLRVIDGQMIVGGDFNARAVEWGMTVTNRRGRLLLEMAARLGLVVMNVGSVTTYRRPGFGESIPDVTFATESIAGQIRNWRVSEQENASDHRYIFFEVSDGRDRPQRRNEYGPRWNLKKIDRERMSGVLQSLEVPIVRTTQEMTGRERAESLVTATTSLITRLCDETMPRKTFGKGRQAVYWWTEEIAQLRKECMKARREAQRMRTREGAEIKLSAYRAARKKLRITIRISKYQKWNELCKSVDADPWGMGYKIVLGTMGKIRPAVNMDGQLVERVIDGLFPTHPVREEGEQFAVDRDSIPLFTSGELIEAVSSLKTGKAPGPDGIPVEILKVIALNQPGVLLEMYNTCLKEGVFSSRWKEARLVLISKNKGDPNSPSAYRPLSLLDSMGKVAEKLLKPRILGAVTAAGGLADNQYGFRKGRSTIGALKDVVTAVHRAREACHAVRDMVALVTLDVENAFNSARWVDILEALNAKGMPAYIMRMIDDYLRERKIIYNTDEGWKKRMITAGAAQGSILGPDFWGIMYDELLRMEMPEGCFLVGYADDVAVIITGRTTLEIQLKLQLIMQKVRTWMVQHGLKIALQKTEIVLLTRMRIETEIEMMVGRETIRTQNAARYLGVTLDSKLTYDEHLDIVSRKAAAKIANLSRLMANTRGPRPAVRRLLMATTNSILLYGAEIWAEAMNVKRYRQRLLRVQRIGASRVASSYRTVATEAIMVIAGVIPVDLLARERKRVYDRSVEIGRERAASEERSTTVQEWQDQWTQAPQGNWTRRLIPRLDVWIGRKCGEVNFYLTQFLSGHGYFRKYLHNMGKVRSAVCKYCGHDKDDAEHTFFECNKWTEDRHRLEIVHGHFGPDNVIGIMTSSEENWREIAHFVERILRAKRNDGCLEN